MDWKSVKITETKWRKFSRELRKNIMDIMPKNQIVDNYADHIVNALNMYGKYELAKRFEEELKTNILHDSTKKEGS